MDLFVIPAGGGSRAPAHRQPRPTTASPAGRPTARSIVFTSDRTGQPAALARSTRDGRNLRRLRTNAATEYQADLSPGREDARLPVEPRRARAADAPGPRERGDARARPPRRRHDLRQPALEPGRPIRSRSRRTGASATRSTSSRSRRGSVRRLSRRGLRRLRAALQPRRPEGRLRQPRPPAADEPPRRARPRDGGGEGARLLAGPQLRPRVLAGRDASSPSPRTSRASTRSTGSGSPTGRPGG